MTRKSIISLVMAILLFTLSSCSNGTTPAADAAVTPPTSAVTPAPEPLAEPVSNESITVQETPVSLSERPEFSSNDKVLDEELISLHGYSIGMTFAETQKVWEIPQNMIDYAIGRWNSETPSLCIYVGNMYYEFKPKADAASNNFDDYILQHIYYGETVFCANRESLSVLRDIKLGDMIDDVLKSLPGNRTPQKWAIDQLYGEYGMPNSSSLEYITNIGFYELRIYCENSWIRLSFGSSGRLWIAEVSSI
ncbi:MAG: hypothetical protein VB078_09135 [Clostridiaceae bacterium]|nr:hypothetical protein [Clostridiaceae bacterium]